MERINFRQAFNSLETAIFMVNSSFEVIYENEKSRFLYPQLLEVNKSFCFSLFLGQRQRCGCNNEECPVEKAFNMLKPVRTNHRYKDRSGDFQWMMITATPLKDSDGNVSTVMLEYRWNEKEQVSEAEEKQTAAAQITEIVKNIPVYIFRWKLYEEIPVEYVSENIVNLGYSAEQFTSGAVSWLDIIHPNDVDRLRQELSEYLENGDDQFSQIYRIYDHSGNIHWMENRNIVMRNNEGSGTHLQGVFLDVTEQKDAEDALVLNRMRFENFIHSLPMGLHGYQVEKDGRLIFTQYNETANKILGVDCSEYVGKTIEEAFPPLADTDIPYRYREVAINGKYWYSEQIQYDDSRISGAYEVYAFQTKKNTVAVVFRDITERKEAEQQLKASQHHTNAILQSIPESAFLIDRDGMVIASNDVAARRFNVTPQEFNGNNIYDYLPSELKQVGRDIIEKVCISKNAETIETMLDERRYSTVLYPVLDSDNGIKQLVIYSVDITEIRENEERLKNLLEEKELLLKEVYHRVKNNFSVLSSLLNLQLRSVVNSEALEILQKSRDRIHSMSMVHDQLYGTENLANVEFDKYIRRLVSYLVSSYQAEENAIELKFKLSKVSLTVEQAIPAGLTVNELVTNSLKYAFPANFKGKRTLSIELKIKKKGDKLKIIVEDNGIGLPGALELSNTKTLGLKLVSILVEVQLEGKIAIQNKNGTKITVTLPQRF